MLNINFKLVKLSPSPIIFTGILFLTVNCLNNFSWIVQKYYFLTIIIITFIIYLIYFYFNILTNENLFIGFYSRKKKDIISNGFMLFIISETMVFISLFWRYIHNAYSPNIFIGNFWPPKGINPANPTRIIIFGTSILIRSRLIIIFRHNLIITKNYKYKSNLYLFSCIFIGIIFIDIQILEIRNFFMKLNFNFNDRIFRRAFLFTTTLHASHVIIGIIGLIYSYILILKNINNKRFYLNFEIRIWYWHFVDYIWIIVFSLFYYFNN